MCGRAFTPKGEGSCLIADCLSEQLLQRLYAEYMHKLKLQSSSTCSS